MRCATKLIQSNLALAFLRGSEDGCSFVVRRSTFFDTRIMNYRPSFDITCLIYDRVLFIKSTVGFSLVPYSLGAWESGSASLKIIGRAHFEKNQLFYRIPYTHFG